MPRFRAAEAPKAKGPEAKYGRAEKNGQGTLFPKAPYKGSRDETVSPRLEPSGQQPGGHVKGQGTLFGPGEFREPKPAPRARQADTRATGRVDTDAAHMPSAPRGATSDSGGRAGNTYNVYNNYGTHYGHGVSNGPDSGSGGAARGGQPGGSQPARSPYGRGSRGQRFAYGVLNTTVNGKSLNDLGHQYAGHQVEFNDQKTGKRVGDPRTDEHKAGKAWDAGNLRAYNQYASDAHQHRASQGVNGRVNDAADRDAIDGQGGNRRRGGRREYRVNNGQYEEI
jgi:hypothetical protein